MSFSEISQKEFSELANEERTIKIEIILNTKDGKLAINTSPEAPLLQIIGILMSAQEDLFRKAWDFYSRDFTIKKTKGKKK